MVLGHMLYLREFCRQLAGDSEASVVCDFRLSDWRIAQSGAESLVIEAIGARPDYPFGIVRRSVKSLAKFHLTGSFLSICHTQSNSFRHTIR